MYGSERAARQSRRRCVGDGARLDHRRMVGGGGANHRAAGGPGGGSEHLDGLPGREGHRAGTGVRRGTGRRQAPHVPGARGSAGGRGARAGEPAREVRAVVVNVDPVRAAPKLMFLALDVSREILLQQRLLQADRLSQLGALVSGVAHELNNPLAAIAAFGEALALDPHQADLQESAEVIRSEAMRAGRIVQTLLDFARQRPRMQTAVDLGEIAERVLALQRSALKKARIRTTISIPNDVPAVAGDPQELQQVMLNAVVNARQAIESTGRPGQIAVTARSSDHHVLVTVDDTGPGVPPEILDRVFEPFFSTKAEHGTGLGLAISFGLVRGMGGRMWMQNIEGGGARLSFELPVDAGSPDAAARGGGRPAVRRLSLLVGEDEEAVGPPPAPP